MFKWQTLYSPKEALQKIDQYLDTGTIQISRFSHNKFSPQLQNDPSSRLRTVAGLRGCYTFPIGFENTYALNHKEGEWYNETPFWLGETNIETQIKCSLTDSEERKWVTIKSYLYFLSSEIIYANEEHSGNATWNDIYFCTGMFLPENAIITNVKQQETYQWKGHYKQ